MANPERTNCSTNDGEGRRPSQADLESRMLRAAAAGKANILPQLEVLVQLVKPEQIARGTAAIEATVREHVHITTINVITLAACRSTLTQDVIQLALLVLFAQKRLVVDWAGGHLWWSLPKTK